MLAGPSTQFSYKPAKEKPRAYGVPFIVRCNACLSYIVGLKNPRSARTVYIPLSRFAERPALVYSHARHGSPHFHDDP